MKKVFYILLIVQGILPCVLFGQITKEQKLNIDSLNLVIKNAKSDTAVAKAYLGLTEILYLSNTDTIPPLSEKALSITNKVLSLNLSEREMKSYYRIRAQAFNNLGVYHANFGELKLGLENYLKSLEMFESLNDKPGIAGSLTNIGYYYKTRGNTVLALEYYLKGLETYEHLNDKKGTGICLTNIGAIYSSLGTIIKALDYYHRSLSIHEEIGNDNGITYSLNNIGRVYQDQGEIDKALEYYLRSLIKREKIGYKKGITDSYINIGYIYNLKNETDKAKKYFDDALLLAHEMNSKTRISAILTHLGLLYEKQLMIDEALSFYKESLGIRKEHGDKQGIAVSLTNIGRIYLRDGLIQQSKRYAKESFKLSQELGFPASIKSSSRLLSEIYQKENNWREAFKKQNLYITMRDSIRNQETEKGIIRQEYKYEYEKQKLADSLTFVKQKEIDELAHLAVLNKEANIRYGLYGGFGLLTVLGIVMYSSYQRKKKDNVLITKQKNELAKKNEEKTAMLKEIHHRVKNNLQVVNSLLNLQSREVEDKHVVSMFKEAQNRVLSMALLHEKMYRSDDLKYIDIQDHITLLVEDLVKSYSVGVNIKSEIDINGIDIGLRTLVPLGLIINEIITNALKYAFKEQDEGKIMVRLKMMENETCELVIGDDGVGLDETQKSSGLGEKLIQNFVRQLEGTIERLEQPGTVFKIQFQKID